MVRKGPANRRRETLRDESWFDLCHPLQRSGKHPNTSNHCPPSNHCCNAFPFGAAKFCDMPAKNQNRFASKCAKLRPSGRTRTRRDSVRLCDLLTKVCGTVNVVATGVMRWRCWMRNGHWRWRRNPGIWFRSNVWCLVSSPWAPTNRVPSIQIGHYHPA